MNLNFTMLVRLVQPFVYMRFVYMRSKLTCIDLHATLAYHDTSSLKNQLKFERYSGRIEVTHFDESMIFMTFTGLSHQGQRSAVSALDPQLQGLGDDPQFQDPLHEIYMIDSDADDVPGKLETYIKRTAPFFYDQETSEFMKPTLFQAVELSHSKKVGII